jgi:hypothetical protein
MTTVIDFESLHSLGSSTIDIGTSYTEDGFRLATNGGQLRLAQDGFTSFYNGSTALFNAQATGSITLTKLDGGPFNLDSAAKQRSSSNKPLDFVLTSRYRTKLARPPNFRLGKNNIPTERGTAVLEPIANFFQPVGMHRLIVSQKYKLNTFPSTVCPNAIRAFETSLRKEAHEHKGRRQNPLYRYQRRWGSCWCERTLSGLRIGAFWGVL